MIRQRVLIDIEFTVDEDRFKGARLAEDPSGVSDVTDAVVREAIADRMISADWSGQGIEPHRSTVTTRAAGEDGRFCEITLPVETGVVQLPPGSL